MPYPNEHSARVRDPGDFESDSFRVKKLPKSKGGKGGVRMIMGRLKGEKTMTVQAYRFPKSLYTPEEAKQWLKDNDVKYISFEAARKSEKSEGILKLGRGKPLEELVKGSLEYTLAQIQDNFRDQFRPPAADYPSGTYVPFPYNIVDSFADYVVVRQWDDSSDLEPDEFYKVGFQFSDGKYIFDSMDQWEIVELAYQPQTLVESKESRVRKGRKLEERIEPSQVQLLEANTEQGDKSTRRIRINGLMRAGAINGNGRRYSSKIIDEMVADWRSHLAESAGQGRLKILTGEADHPATKGNARPQLLETVVRWTDLKWNGEQLDVEGNLILTSKGKDVEILMEAGVYPGGSVRGYYDSKQVKENGKMVEEVLWGYLTGADLVGDPSFENTAELAESIQNQTSQEDEMDIEQLKKFIQDNPDLFEGLVTKKIEEMNEAQLKAVEAKMRQALNLDESADLPKALAEAAQAKKELDEQKKKQDIEAAITEATKSLPYGEEANKLLTESLRAANPLTPEAVKAVFDELKKSFDKRAADDKLKGMGFKPAGVHVVGPVLEEATGYPEFARAAFELTESIRKTELRPRRDLRKPKTLNEEFAALYLARFDEQYKRQLLAEAKQFEEAEQASDLNLPYMVSRAVIAEAFPQLVAISMFDFAMAESAKITTLYYEAFSGESGYTVALSGISEAIVCTLQDTWYAIAHARITPGTVVVKNVAETVTYVEGTDYVIDYAAGRIKTMGATLTAPSTVHLTAYTYTAIRKGEMATIEQMKLTLATKTLTLGADRLATEISREAIVFSRGSLGYDATARTLASLTRQIARRIDQGVIWAGLSAALSVASNSGGTWTAATDPISDLIEYLGVSKVKILNRYYQPTGILLSMTNGDKIANWDGFTQAGARPDADLNAEGYIGRLKGLPVLQSTEMSDAYALVANRELVMHRVGQTLQIFGPFPTYDQATAKLIAADQYYAEEFNVTDAPVAEKGSTVKIA